MSGPYQGDRDGNINHDDAIWAGTNHEDQQIPSSFDPGSANAIFEMFKDLSREAKEHFISLHLDNKNKILCIDRVSVGSLTASVVHPREVFKTALLSSAAAVVFIHNHPSGDPEPSREDLDITTRLKQCGELLGIRILDHVVIGENRYCSFSDRGYL